MADTALQKQDSTKILLSGSSLDMLLRSGGSIDRLVSGGDSFEMMLNQPLKSTDIVLERLRKRRSSGGDSTGRGGRALERLLAHKLRNAGLIKTRWYRCKPYRACLVGTEIVAWMLQNNLASSEQECITTVTTLVDAGLLHHVTDAHSFKNEFLFYRFYADEENMRNSSSLGRKSNNTTKETRRAVEHENSMDMLIARMDNSSIDREMNAGTNSIDLDLDSLSEMEAEYKASSLSLSLSGAEFTSADLDDLRLPSDLKPKDDKEPAPENEPADSWFERKAQEWNQGLAAQPNAFSANQPMNDFNRKRSAGQSSDNLLAAERLAVPNDALKTQKVGSSALVGAGRPKPTPIGALISALIVKVKKHEATEVQVKTLVTLVSQLISALLVKMNNGAELATERTKLQSEVKALVDLASQTLIDVGSYAQACNCGERGVMPQSLMLQANVLMIGLRDLNSEWQSKGAAAFVEAVKSVYIDK